MKNRKEVYSSVNGNVMTITFDNPETKNGLTWVGTNQLCDYYEEIISNKDIKVVVYTGNDEFFYTGGRVNPKNPGEKEKYADGIARLTELNKKITTPRIAAISGYCAKAGMGLLEACDFAVVREGVCFSYPEVRMGGVPMMVMAETYGNMPKKKALEAYLTSWDFTAEDAYRMGLVNAVVPAENFWATVQKYIDVFLNTPEVIVRMTLKAFREMGKLPDFDSRSKLAMEMLRSEVLTTMAKTETKYNI